MRVWMCCVSACEKLPISGDDYALHHSVHFEHLHRQNHTQDPSQPGVTGIRVLVAFVHSPVSMSCSLTVSSRDPVYTEPSKPCHHHQASPNTSAVFRHLHSIDTKVMTLVHLKIDQW